MAIRECGKVIEIHEDSMTVQINPPSMCDSCTACGGSQRKERTITVPAQPDIHEGDDIWIEAVPGDLLKAVLLVFMLPTAGLFAGIAFAAYILSTNKEWVYFVCALIGTILPFFLAKFLVNRYVSFHKNIWKK